MPRGHDLYRHAPQVPVARAAALLLVAAIGCGDNTLPAEPDAPSAAACSDGLDNDGDGAIDFPADPGCVTPDGDAELDDCPAGPACPQCGNGADDDGNGSGDFPADRGCTSASDPVEFAAPDDACGAGIVIEPLPVTRTVSGTLDASSTAMLESPCSGTGPTPARAYQMYLPSTKLVVATTEDPVTTANTVLDLRATECAQPAAEVACNDDATGAASGASRVAATLPAGNYYIVVSAHDPISAGAFTLRVTLYTAEGDPCASDDECGVGLICRSATGGAPKTCQPPSCGDQIDNDGDGRVDYPMDPGCVSPDDDSELDPCPGAGCPECGDGVDNDGDTKIDFPADPTCLAASDASEACVTAEPITTITTSMTSGDTSGAVNDLHPACASTVSHTAPDRLYRLDLPALDALDLELVGLVPAFWDSLEVLYDSTCGGAALACTDQTAMHLTNLAAGSYFYAVDGYTGAMGAYTIRVSGTIARDASCEGALFASGALRCASGDACRGIAGQRTCLPAACGDGMDQDGDGRIDYPADPGCASRSDDDETDPVPAPTCADSIDNDGDGLSDWPADPGCAAASGTSELFCPVEVDPTSVITSSVTLGTTALLTSSFPSQSCQASAAGGDVVYALPLPVDVSTLVLDTSTSAFDTVVSVRDAQCGLEYGCDDDSGAGSQSTLTLTNVTAGNYAVIVDGYSGGSSPESGMFTLEIRGVVAPNTPCDSPLFSGANPVLSCPTGTMCTGVPVKCQ